MAQLKIINCIATPTAALLYFSEPLGPGFSPEASMFVVRRASPGPLQQSVTVTLKSNAYDSTANTVTIQLDAQPPLKVGDLISVQGIKVRSAEDNTEPSFVRVNGEETQAEANARR